MHNRICFSSNKISDLEQRQKKEIFYPRKNVLFFQQAAETVIGTKKPAILTEEETKKRKSRFDTGKPEGDYIIYYIPLMGQLQTYEFHFQCCEI